MCRLSSVNWVSELLKQRREWNLAVIYNVIMHVPGHSIQCWSQNASMFHRHWWINKCTMCSSFESWLNQLCLVVPQTLMNATLEMEAVNTVVLTLLGASSAAVIPGTSWRKTDWTAVVRVYELTNQHDLPLHVHHSLTGCIALQRTGLYRYRGFGSLNQCLVVTQTSMNATLQIEAVNTVVLTLLGVSSVAVTQGTSWMEMDWTAAVRKVTPNKRSACFGT